MHYNAVRRPVRIDGDAAYIPLTLGYEAVIDADDVPLVSKHNWYSQIRFAKDRSILTVYAIRSAWLGNGKRRTVLLHRSIMGDDDPREVDHRDGDGLNNRRSNLRFATKSQNQHNMQTPVNNVSGVKGVWWDKEMSKWCAGIRVNGKLRHLGYHIEITDAAAAYAKASAEFHGEFGRIS